LFGFAPAKAGASRTSGNAAEIVHGYTLSMEKIRIEQHSFMGIVWFGAWLFTIGFLRLTFWKGVLAIVLWPYYLGLMFSSAGR
jgi:hypothetical protein